MLIDFHSHISVPGSFLPESDGHYYRTLPPISQAGQVFEHLTRDAVDLLSETWRTPAAIKAYRNVGPVIYTEMSRRLMSSNSTKLLAEMSDNGITSSVVVAIDPYVPTAGILKACENMGGLLIPFGSANTQAQNSVGNFHNVICSEVRGIKFHSDLQNLPIGGDLLNKLLDVLAESSRPYLPVYLHTGNFPIYRPSDLRWEITLPELLERYPTITFVCGHSGWDSPKAAVRAALKHKNLYLETSWQSSHAIRRLCDVLGPERLLLGSDYPLYSQRRAVRNMKNALSDAEQKVVGYDNAARLLKL